MKYLALTQQVFALVLFNLISISLFADISSTTTDPTFTETKMITIRIGPNGDTHFVYGDGAPYSSVDSERLDWLAITAESKEFGEMQFLTKS